MIRTGERGKCKGKLLVPSIPRLRAHGQPSRLLVTLNVVKVAAEGVQMLVIGWDDELEGLSDEG